jgi:hypothetical protein
MILDLTFPDYCKQDGINASSLKHFAGEPFSPKTACYKYQTPSKESEAFKVGRAVHAWLEYCNKMPDEYEVLPYHKWNEKGAKAAKSDCIEAKRIPLTISEGREIAEMSNALWNNSVLNPIVSSDSCMREMTVLHGEFKAMIDVIDVDGRAIHDWKTTRRTTLKDIERDCYTFGYHIQAYHYLMVASAELDVDTFYFDFVSTVAPYETFVLKCSDEFVEAGKKDWEIAKERFDTYSNIPYCDCPGLCENVVELDLPEWAMGEEEEQLLEDFE